MRLGRVVALMVLGVLMVTGVAVAQESKAGAEMEDAEGNVVGDAQVTEDSGDAEVAVRAEGLEPGEHGIHFHETGECEPADSKAFGAAGAHFNPEETKHGLDSTEGPHAGDLPNMTVNEDGTAEYEATTGRVTLSGGEGNLLDTDGSSLVIHAKADDQKTDPTGESGDRVTCGVIETSTVAAQKGTSAGGSGVVPLMLVVAFAFILVISVFLYRRS